MQFSAVENNAAIYEWRLNGELVSNGRIFNYQFPEIGMYELELTIKNSQFRDAYRTSHKENIQISCVAQANFEVETLSIIPEDSLYFNNINLSCVVTG